MEKESRLLLTEKESRLLLTEKDSRLRHVLNRLNHPIFWRKSGFLSCVVGLLCYALSSSFKSLFGQWNPTKIVLYIILSSIISVVVLFAPKSRDSVVSKLKPHVEFLVLMLTSLYSFFADRSTNGKPDTWSVVSSVAFALTSLCLSRQIKPAFDVGLFGYFLGCATVQLMKIHPIFILVAAGFCYLLVVLGSCSESQSENADTSAEESVAIRIIDDDDDANRMTACFRYPPPVFWSYFEKLLWPLTFLWPKVATTEQFLWDQEEEREKLRRLQQQQEEWDQQDQEWEKLRWEQQLQEQREQQQQQVLRRLGLPQVWQQVLRRRQQQQEWEKLRWEQQQQVLRRLGWLQVRQQLSMLQQLPLQHKQEKKQEMEAEPRQIQFKQELQRQIQQLQKLLPPPP